MSTAMMAKEHNITCTFTKLAPQPDHHFRVTPTIEKYEAALLIIVGFGGFSLFVAFIHNLIRRYVYRDSQSLDKFFDAGGRVSLSLTAVTVTSQVLWPADFLQMATNTSMTGIAGALFFETGVVVGLILFPIFSLELKTKAPGAKTFLQIIYSRFGRNAHILFCVIAVMTNLITMTSLLLAGRSVLLVLTKDISDEFVALVLAVLFGSYCFIGGLGTTFYISYFNTAITFVTVLIFVLNVSYLDNSDVKYTSKESMYDAMKCIQGPDGNAENSLLTFQSRSSAVYGLAVFFMSTSVTLCDQASWQSRIAAKPTQGVLGYFIAAFLYFTLPLNVSVPSCMTYMAMVYENGTQLLTESDIANGFITPFIMNTVMGSRGGYLLLMMCTMALMSTGSGEVMAVSSILVYDVYKVYINPFRKGISQMSCQLCGKEKADPKADTGICQCQPAENCPKCNEDVVSWAENEAPYRRHYTCDEHGPYRRYEDLLNNNKSWCIVWVTVFIVPYALVLFATDINLTWFLFFVESLLTPCIVPLILTIKWARCTSTGVIAGTLTGLLADVSGILVVTATVYENGLNDFFENSVKDFSVLGGSLAGLLVSIVVTVSVSMATHKIENSEDIAREWEKTMSIDNPMISWRKEMAQELADISSDTKISTSHLSEIFKTAKYTAFIGGSICLVFYLIVIPSIVTSLDVLSFDQFSKWLTFCHIICLIGGIYVIIAPPVEEIFQIAGHFKIMKKRNGNENDVNESTKSENTKL